MLRSIGYKGLPIDETVPFDAQRGIIPSTNSRVDGCPGRDVFFDYLSLVVHFGSACTLYTCFTCMSVRFSVFTTPRCVCS